MRLIKEKGSYCTFKLFTYCEYNDRRAVYFKRMHEYDVTTDIYQPHSREICLVVLIILSVCMVLLKKYLGHPSQGVFQMVVCNIRVISHHTLHMNSERKPVKSVLKAGKRSIFFSKHWNLG